MDDFAMNVDGNGSVMSKEDLKRHRLKQGLCKDCGIKCYEKKYLRWVPITQKGMVFEGECLACEDARLQTNIREMEIKAKIKKDCPISYHRDRLEERAIENSMRDEQERIAVENQKEDEESIRALKREIMKMKKKPTGFASDFNEVQKDVAAIQPTNIEEQQGTTKLNSHNNTSSTTNTDETDQWLSEFLSSPDNISCTTNIDEVDQLQEEDTLARALSMSLNDQVRGMPFQLLNNPNNIQSTTTINDIDQLREEDRLVRESLRLSLNDTCTGREHENEHN